MMKGESVAVHMTFAPLNPGAEPICSLTREEAFFRVEPPDRLLLEASSTKATPRGIEYTFSSSEAMIERLVTFIHEEMECCPFLEFECMKTGRRWCCRFISLRQERSQPLNLDVPKVLYWLCWPILVGIVIFALVKLL
jgi:hypothetical protein